MLGEGIAEENNFWNHADATVNMRVNMHERQQQTC